MTNTPRNQSTGKTKPSKASRGTTIIVKPPAEKEETGMEEEETGTPAPSQEPQDDLSSLSGEGFVRVSRVKPNGEKSFLRKVERGVLGDNIGFIGTTWGGGAYFLEVFNEKKMWVRRFHMSFDETEFGPPKYAGMESGLEVEPGGEPPAYPGYPPAGPSMSREDRHRDEIKQLMEESRERERAYNERIQQMQSDNMKFVMGTMEKMMRPADNPTASIENLVSVADRMLQTRPATQDPNNHPLNGLLTRVAEQLMEKAMERGDTGGDGASPIERIGMKLLESFGPHIARAVAAGAMAVPRQPVPVTGSPPPTGQPSTPIAKEEKPVVTPALPSEDNGNHLPQEVPPQNLMNAIKEHPIYKLVAPSLVQMAKNGMAASDAAEKIDEMVPDRYFDIMQELVKHEDVVGYLSVFEPEIAEHREWILKVAKLLREEEEVPATNE